MKTLRDPQNLLRDGLQVIRDQFKVPAGFPAPVEDAAAKAASRIPSGYADLPCLS